MDHGLHHALVLDGDRMRALEHARTLITEHLQLTIEANPDILFHEHDRFGVDEARTLKQRAYQLPLGERQVFVIAANLLTREAQNSLLKLLEEPPARTHFILIVPNIRVLIDTIHSRTLHLGTFERTSIDHDRAAAFCAASVRERLDIIKPLIDAKDRTGARLLLEDLERHLIEQKGVRAHVSNLREIAFAESYIRDTSSSIKMLLEHVALTLSV